MEESRSEFIEVQYEEHKVIIGMLNTNMPMVTNRMMCFLVILEIVNPLRDTVPNPLYKATVVYLHYEPNDKDFFKIGNAKKDTKNIR